MTRLLRALRSFDPRTSMVATAMMELLLSFDTLTHGARLEAPMKYPAATDFPPPPASENETSLRPLAVRAANPSDGCNAVTDPIR